MTLEITPSRLDSLFRPRSVALVGAADKSVFSQLAYRNLDDFGFADRTYLVNRRGAVTHGRSTVTSCGQIGEPVDVAFMMVPQAGTLDALSDAAAAGIRNAVILSSGYGETGQDGRAAEVELVAHARSLDMLLLGPNHLGFANFTARTPVTSIPGLPPEAGPVALLSQSGGSSAAMLDFATASGVGLSLMVTLGNEAMITAAHVLDYLVDDRATRAVAVFLETVREPDVFRHAARRALAAGKAVVALKAGSSELSARTAAAHTGALVGNDRVIDAVFRDLGVIRVDSIEDMLLTAGAGAYLGRLARPGVGVVSISGGACDILADRAQDFGMSLPELAPETTSALTEIMPAYGTVQNPLDVTGTAINNPAMFTGAITAMSADPSIGVVAVVNSLPWESDGRPYATQAFVDAIGDGIASARGPVVHVNQVQQPITKYTRQVMDAGRVPYVLPGLRQAVTALSGVAWWSGLTGERAPDSDGPVVTIAAERQRGAWSEIEARALLAEAGIPVVPGQLATSADEAAKLAAEFGGPVALKIVSTNILHKSDIGGVQLGIVGDQAARRAYDDVAASALKVPGARVDGVLVTPMRSGGLELLVGVVRDPHWGPMLAVAVGGIFVEALGDSVLSPLPVSTARATEMLRGMRASALLDGVRGGQPVDVDEVASVIRRIGDLAVALGGELESLEVNPLWVNGGMIEALDAVVTWSPK